MRTVVWWFFGFFAMMYWQEVCALCDSTCSLCFLGICTCFTNAQLATVPGPTVCECVSTAYTLTTAANCQLCDLSCATCSSGSASSCKSCSSTNAELASGTPGPCTCKTGFFPRPTIANCATICDDTCLTCSGLGPTNCLSCFANAALSSGQCICNPLTYPTPTARSCLPCDPSCSTCTGSSNTQCMSCSASAQLTAGTCVCIPPLVPDPDARLCVKCDPTCQTCSAAGPNGCMTCTPNTFLNGVPPTFCVCSLGYYRNDVTCIKCAGGCSTCSGLTVSQCLTCYPNAALVGAAPNSCSCSTGFFPLPDSSNCVACSNQCLNCVGTASTACIACKTGAGLLSAGTSACGCLPGFYPNPDPGTCSPCDVTCQTCSSSGKSACQTCKLHANLQGSPPGLCYCQLGFGPQPDASNCVSNGFCHPACESCTTPDINSCLSCKTNALLQGNGPAQCSCQIGYYGNPDASVCALCYSSCVSCQGAKKTDCTGCKTGAKLLGGSPAVCRCRTGFYSNPDASNCSRCGPWCLICSKTACYQCEDGYWLSNGVCSQCPLECAECASTTNCTMCVSGKHLNITGSCLDCGNCGEPLRPAVTSPYDHKYKIEFNRKVLNVFGDSDFSIETDPVSQVNWTVIPGPELLLRIGGGPWTNATIFTLVFTRARDVLDQFGFRLSVSEVQLAPPLQSIVSGHFQPNITNSSIPETASNPSPSSGLKAVFGTLAATSLALSYAAGAGSFAMPFLTQITSFSYISQVRIQFPEDVRTALVSMNVKSMFPNFFYDGNYVRGRLLYGQLISDGQDFFSTAGGLISVFLLISALHGICRLLFLLRKRNSLLIITKLVTYFEWSIYLHFANFAYLDLLISCLFQLESDTLSVDQKSVLLATVLSGLLLLMLVAYPGYMFMRVYNYKKLQRSIEEVGRPEAFDSIFSNIRMEKPNALYYLPLSLIQRFSYAVAIVYLNQLPSLQGTILILPVMLMLSFVLVVQPLKFRSVRVLHTLAELENLSVFVLLMIAQFSINPIESVTWAILVLTLKSSCCLFLIVVIPLLHRFIPIAKRFKTVSPTMPQISSAIDDTAMEVPNAIKSTHPWHITEQTEDGNSFLGKVGLASLNSPEGIRTNSSAWTAWESQGMYSRRSKAVN